MKRILFFIALSFIVTFAKGNIAPPKAYISEIYFDSGGNWTIELGFYGNHSYQIDSIIIESSTGSSKINFFTLIPGGGFPNFDSLAVVTNLNMLVPVSINPLFDYIKVTSYINIYGSSDYIAIGNYPGSFLDCRHDGESIILAAYMTSAGETCNFCIDKTPTIGFVNDTTGAMGSFSGLVYDLSGNVFTQGFFMLPPLAPSTINIQPDGSFFERILSRRYTFDTITIYFPPWPYTSQTYVIEPVDFCLRPDTIQIQNIITKSLVTGIDHYRSDNGNVVIVSPNPFHNKVSFFINISNQNPSDEMSLSIFTQDGKLLKLVELTGDQQKFEWVTNNLIPAGVLLFNLKKNGRTLKSGKFLKL